MRPKLALGDLATDRFRVVDLRAIGAKIEPAGIGVLHDNAIGCADIPRLILLMVPRHRKFQYVNIVALDHVLENRPIH